MKLYAVRDRLLNYYQQPFAAHQDQDVLAACARSINNPEVTDVIAQAPHHFEIWILGEIQQETGDFTAKKDILANCASLIRRDIPTGATRRPGDSTGTAAPPSSTRTPESTGELAGASHSDSPDKTQESSHPSSETGQRAPEGPNTR